MKKLLSKILVATLCLICLPFSLLACSPEGNSEFITAEPQLTWQSSYLVGEQINLQGLDVAYYTDVDDLSKCQTIPATLDMVKGFDSSTAGTKSLTLVYKGMETQSISYTVVSLPEVTVNGTFCINDNLVANFNSQTMKVTVTKYQSFADFVAGNGASTNLDLTKKAESYFGEYYPALTFNYENVRYAYVASEQPKIAIYHEGSSKHVNAMPLQSPSPVINVEYHSDVDSNGKVAVAIFGQDYSLKLYVVDQSVTDLSTVTPVTTFTREQAILSTSGVIRYSSVADLTTNVYVTGSNTLSFTQYSTSNIVETINHFTCTYNAE